MRAPLLGAGLCVLAIYWPGQVLGQSIYTSYAFTTLAGSVGFSGSGDGTGSAARFSTPFGVAVDSAGNVFVADWANHTIRKVTSAGEVTTLAGSAGSAGTNDGTGTAARFNNPTGVAVDSTGNVFVADSRNYTIRKVTAAGVVTTLAGRAMVSGSADGTGTSARFTRPTGVAVDSAGNVFVADLYHMIRKVTAAGVVTTLAGRAMVSGTNDGMGSSALFNQPTGVAVDSAGNLFVADTWNSTIRKITTAGVVTTLAGKAFATGSVDGEGASARFYYPWGPAVDSTGNVFMADLFNHTIRKLTAAGVVTTVAGRALEAGSADGAGASARFYYPQGVAVDGAGNLYVADSNNHTIRKGFPCNYTLSVAGAAFGASGSVGSFVVSSSGGCEWGATADQSWLHTTNRGSGNGTVYYTVDANGGSAFRTGTITVGGQTFTITQGPAGFAWHNVFGWIFNAGSGWYHHNGFGWMWFSSGQWIWSGSLNGWVATMDSTSRTLWSPQFRWLTPSESDPYQAETTAIGAIYLGQYNGAAITDGWVVSGRFGYVWAAGDGKWFFSNTYGWLGVTEAGGIWCVNQGRFL